MRTISRDDGFTLTELLVSSTITLLVLGGAMTTVKNALTLNDTGTQLADANQNLRAGTNLLIKDLMQAGRKMPSGISIPSGDNKQDINRPSPPGLAYTFDNTNSAVLPAIVTGYGLGPVVDNSSTDMITLTMIDSEDCQKVGIGAIADSGLSATLASTSPWLTGVPTDPACSKASATRAGDLIWFSGGNGAIRTVTSVGSGTISFAENNTNDWFNFNQSAAAHGTLIQLSDPSKPAGQKFPAMTLFRVIMLTYYVDATTTPGTPRLMRMQNHFGPQALAGVVEDLDITYDLVDGSVNPVKIPSLPYTLNGDTYTSNQIRKVNLHVGVRSDLTSAVRRNDYIRNHINTSVNIRELSSVSVYFKTS